jgi:hypothetical protein
MSFKKQLCTCGRKLHDHSDLVVVNRYSTNLHKLTRFSQVKCTRPNCEGTWQTDSKYVNELPDV